MYVYISDVKIANPAVLAQKTYVVLTYDCVQHVRFYQGHVHRMTSSNIIYLRELQYMRVKRNSDIWITVHTTVNARRTMNKKACLHTQVLACWSLPAPSTYCLSNTLICIIRLSKPGSQGSCWPLVRLVCSQNVPNKRACFEQTPVKMTMQVKLT